MITWIQKGRPTDNLDTRKFRIVKVMKTHIKYCPVDNPEEGHIIRKLDFRHGFKQDIGD